MINSSLTYCCIVTFFFTHIGFAESQTDSIQDYDIVGLIKSGSTDIISYIPVTLLSEDSVLLKGTLTDSIGNYYFDNIESGHYLIGINPFGGSYSGLHAADLTVSDSIIHMPNIVISDHSFVTMSEVTIKAKKSFIEHRVDRTIVNLSNSPLATGNNMIDVLKRLPGITIRNEDEVFVNGLAGVAIYIDGKGTALSQREVQSILGSVQGSNVEKVEIYTSPPARFGADQNAVINIITKKRKMKSRVGGVLGQALYPLSDIFGSAYNNQRINANMHWNAGKLNINYLMNIGRSSEITKLKQTDFLPELTRDALVDSKKESFSHFHLLSGMIDVSEKDEVFFKMQFLAVPKSATMQENNNTVVRISDSNIENFKTIYSNDVSISKPEFLLNYSRTINKEKNHKISFDLIGGNFGINSDLAFDNQGESVIQDQQNLSDLNFSAFRTDYTLKIGGVDFSSGLKYTDLNYSSEIQRSPQTTNFNYDEIIYAGYASLSTPLIGFQTKVGLRYENTTAIGRSSSLGEPINNDFGNLFPSIFILKDLSEKASISGSYSRRIRRPSFEHYNPNRAISTYEQFVEQNGNPLLRPQLTSKYELKFRYGVVGFQFNASKENDAKAIAPIFSSGNVLTLETTNIDIRTIGSALNFSYSITDKWNTYNNANLTYFKNFLTDDFVTTAWEADMSTAQNIELNDHTTIDIYVSYRSSVRYNYWDLGGQFRSDISVNFKILKKSGDLKVAVNNFFGAKTPYWNENYGDIRSIERYLSTDRNIRVSFSYNFEMANRFRVKRKNSSDGDIR